MEEEMKKTRGGVWADEELTPAVDSSACVVVRKMGVSEHASEVGDL